MPTCPSCGSSRVQGGYRPPHIFLRLVGIRELLCNECNYLYRAFSPIPPRTPRKHESRKPVVTPPKPQPRPPSQFQGSSRICPHCGSSDTRRRRRSRWERVFLALSEKRPFWCNGCGGSFYIKSGPPNKP